MAEKVKNNTKSTKKVSPKKTVSNNTRQSISNEVPKTNKYSETNRAVKAVAIIIFVCAFFFIIAYLFKGVFVAASVNGEPISRIVVIKTLEKQSGQMVLDNLITKKLILQEADKRKIIIAQSDIDKEIKTISDNLKKQGTTLEQAMAGQGMTREELIDELRVQIALRKMTEGENKVSDKEIADFIETNRSSFPEDVTADEAKLKNMAKAQLEQQKAAEKTQALITDLQKKAKIMHYAGY